MWCRYTTGLYTDPVPFPHGVRSAGVSLIAGFTLSAESLALDPTLRRHPEVIVEVERLATHSREWVMPFLWVSGPNLDEFERSMERDPTVEGVQLVQESEDIRLYNVHWVERVQLTIDSMADQHAIITEMEARDRRWYLKLRFRKPDLLEEFQTHFAERGFEFELRQLETSPEPKQRQFGLTEKQREALVTALDHGYFEVPRGASMAELADLLGVAPSTASERVRRATGALVHNALTVSLPREE